MSRSHTWHTRLQTGRGLGPVYLFLEVGVNRTPMVQTQLNCRELSEAVAAMEDALVLLREALGQQQRRHDEPTQPL